MAEFFLLKHDFEFSPRRQIEKNLHDDKPTWNTSSCSLVIKINTLIKRFRWNVSYTAV